MGSVGRGVRAWDAAPRCAGSPQGAALLAITNQMRGSKGNLSSTAQVLPTIYTLTAQQFASAGSPQYFHDATAGATGGNAAQTG